MDMRFLLGGVISVLKLDHLHKSENLLKLVELYLQNLE